MKKCRLFWKAVAPIFTRGQNRFLHGFKLMHFPVLSNVWFFVRLLTAKAIATASILLGATLAHATCALSTEPHPSGEIGLQLLYPDRELGWRDASELGARWIRAEIRWDWIQAGPNSAVDEKYADKVFEHAAAHPEIRLMLLLNHVPTWAARDHDLLPGRAAAAAAWLIRRYGQHVRALEVFNEVNLVNFGWPDTWATPKESATTYGKTLAAVSSAIREIDRKVFVVSAGLSDQGDPESFVRWMVRTTPSQCFDALGLHPYSQSGKFASVQRNASMLLQQEIGHTKPIWATEFGTASNAERGALLDTLAIESTLVPMTIVFNDIDIGWISDTYGLRTKTGRPKPDFAQFKRLFAGQASETRVSTEK